MQNGNLTSRLWEVAKFDSSKKLQERIYNICIEWWSIQIVSILIYKKQMANKRFILGEQGKENINVLIVFHQLIYRNALL